METGSDTVSVRRPPALDSLPDPPQLVLGLRRVGIESEEHALQRDRFLHRIRLRRGVATRDLLQGLQQRLRGVESLAPVRPELPYAEDQRPLERCPRIFV